MAATAVAAGWTWAVEVVREDERPVAQGAVAPDWAPWREWVRWRALEGGAPPEAAFTGECEWTPVWDPAHGAPRLEGVECATGQVAERFGLDPFREPARAMIAGLVRDGRLEKGDLVRWRALAFARQGPPPEPAARVSRAAPPAIPVRAAPLPRAAEDAELPVLLPDQVLAEVAELTLGTTGHETGGILVGHLCRDPASGRLWNDVTAQVPARHTEAGATRLTFTARTWTEVRAAIALRSRDEIMLGWWHSHPVRHWCRECPAERRAECTLARGFLSEDDRRLHREVFPRAFSLALVANDVDPAPTFTLFGWRRGLIEPRSFTPTGGSADGGPT